MVTEGQPTQQVWFREICLWKQKPEAWWENSPGLMALFPLCRHELSIEKAISYPAKVIGAKTTDTITRADLLTTLAIFGKLAHPEFDVLKVVGREKMKESKLYQEILAEGREEGREEGRLEARRTDILGILEARFGVKAAEEFNRPLNALGEPKLLLELLQLAARCPRLADFRQQFSSKSKKKV